MAPYRELNCFGPTEVMFTNIRTRIQMTLLSETYQLRFGGYLKAENIIEKRTGVMLISKLCLDSKLDCLNVVAPLPRVTIRKHDPLCDRSDRIQR